jgi:hypothetical protein
LLNDRLTAVCNLRDNLGVSVAATTREDMLPTVSSRGLDMELLERFDDVVKQHRISKEYAQKIATIQQSKMMDQPELRSPSMLSAYLGGAGQFDVKCSKSDKPTVATANGKELDNQEYVRTTRE